MVIYSLLSFVLVNTISTFLGLPAGKKIFIFPQVATFNHLELSMFKCKLILILKFYFFIFLQSHVCPTAQLYIHSSSKQWLNNSMQSPGFGAARCIKCYSSSYEFVSWKQEAMTKNQIDMNVTVEAQAACCGNS